VNQVMTATARSSSRVASVTEDHNWSLRLLASGVISAPLFVGVVLVGSVTRQGFDLVRMPLSLLSLGDAGWVQRANFIACGLLFALGTIGMAHRRIPGCGVWSTRLLGMFAVGLIAAGLFPRIRLWAFRWELRRLLHPGFRAGIPSCTAMRSTSRFYRQSRRAFSLPVVSHQSAKLVGQLMRPPLDW
jgi:hypothetical protein